jgi:hypothetical protein
MRWLWRLVAVPFGLMFAVTASSLFLVIAAIIDPVMRTLAGVALWVGFWPLFDPALSIEDQAALADAGRVLATVLLAPPVFVALVSEVLGARRLVWHAGATAVVTGALPWLVRGGARTATPEEVRISIILALTGAVAGFVYWLIAGRRAGREPEPVNGTMSLGS